VIRESIMFSAVSDSCRDIFHVLTDVRDKNSDCSGSHPGGATFLHDNG
jgi:hypothetical protein